MHHARKGDVQLPWPAAASLRAATHGIEMTWTTLPAMFVETLPLAVVGGAALAGPSPGVGEGRRRLSFVAVRDVAAYNVAALSRTCRRTRRWSSVDPEPLTWRDIVAVFADALDHDVPVRTLPPGTVPGMPDVVSGVLTALETHDSPWTAARWPRRTA